MVMKVCTKCKIEKEESEFGKNKNSKDGLRHYCKLCRSEAESIYKKHKKDYDKIYNQENKEKRHTQSIKWAKENPEARKVITRKWKSKNKYKEKAYRQGIKKKVIDYYGGFCQCCGEDNIVFLCIDHINGGGNKHLKEINKSGGSFYKWLISNNFPEGFQTLCHNCNFAKHVLGECVHKTKIWGKSEEAGED